MSAKIRQSILQEGGGRETGAGRDLKALRTRLAAIALVVLVVLLWLTLRGRLPITGGSNVLVLYGFSTMNEVVEDGLLPAFREVWERETGEGVEVVTAFAGSGTIVDRIIKKYPAEVAILASEMDAYRAPVRWESWRQFPHGGVLCRTPIVIFVREGNPKSIEDFDDLTGAGIEIVHPDPKTSGGANWAILAQYGAAFHEAGDRQAAYSRLFGIWRNVSIRTSSAREARLRFQAGSGDALITYEQDLLGNPSRPRPRGEIIYPRRTILSEPVVAEVERNIEDRQRRLVDAFISFLWSRQAQEILVDYGFHSVYDEPNRKNPSLGTIEDPFTLASLGGAIKAQREIVDSAWRQIALREPGP